MNPTSVAAERLVLTVQRADEAPYGTRRAVLGRVIAVALDLYSLLRRSHIVIMPQRNVSYEDLLSLMIEMADEMASLDKDLRLNAQPSGYGPRVRRVQEKASAVQWILEGAEEFAMPRRRVRDDQSS